MESKYYTPEIEEFHKGFEFEWFENQFKKDTFAITTDDDLEIIDDEIREGKIRVKLLDKEDVLSFGWKDDGNDWFRFRSNTNHNYELSIYDDNRIHIYFIRYNNGEKKFDQYFAGYCKNKSELKKLMVQIGIINK